MKVPRHTHRGSEMVCVLKGAFDDEGVATGWRLRRERDGARP